MWRFGNIERLFRLRFRFDQNLFPIFQSGFGIFGRDLFRSFCRRSRFGIRNRLGLFRFFKGTLLLRHFFLSIRDGLGGFYATDFGELRFDRTVAFLINSGTS